MCEEWQIDINTAEKEDLMKITGLGGMGIIAQRVIDGRPFTSIDDLINVKGIGNATLAKIKAQNLACIADEKINTEEEFTNNLTNNNTTLVDELMNKEVVIENSPRIFELKPVTTNPQVIKSDSDSSFSNNSNHSIWGLFIFMILLGLLFLIRKRKKKKEKLI